MSQLFIIEEIKKPIYKELRKNSWFYKKATIIRN